MPVTLAVEVETYEDEPQWTHLRNLTNRVMAVIDDADHAHAAVETLRSHGAHFINAYGQWTIESIAA